MPSKYVLQQRGASGLENKAEVPALENGKIDMSWLPVVGESGAAIIARGSNANGEWVRWEDGTQICRSTIELSEIDVPETYEVWNSNTYTPPASFVGTYDICVVSARGLSSDSSSPNIFLASAYIYTQTRIWNTGRASSQVTPGVAVRGTEGNSYNVTSAIIRVVAIGRWK